LERKYYRFSVGGLSDVAEIKGDFPGLLPVFLTLAQYMYYRLN